VKLFCEIAQANHISNIFNVISTCQRTRSMLQTAIIGRIIVDKNYVQFKSNIAINQQDK